MLNTSGYGTHKIPLVASHDPCKSNFTNEGYIDVQLVSYIFEFEY